MRAARKLAGPAGLAALAALVAPCALLGTHSALAGPDFATGNRSQPLAASDAHYDIAPTDTVMFTLGSAALSDTAEDQLVDAAHWLAGHPDQLLVLEGYTDATGGAAYNADLAARRAEAARARLIAAGVDGDHIVTAVYGENRASHAQPGGDLRDRRVVIYASAAPLSQVVASELGHDAIELSWTQHGSIYRESRGITPVAEGPERIRTATPHGG